MILSHKNDFINMMILCLMSFGFVYENIDQISILYNKNRIDHMFVDYSIPNTVSLLNLRGSFLTSRISLTYTTP